MSLTGKNSETMIQVSFDLVCEEDFSLGKREEKNQYDTKKKKSRKTEALDEFLAEHMKLSCSLCSFPVDNFGQLEHHTLSLHKISPFVQCCNRKFFTRSTLVDHIHSHLNPNYFKCNKCEKILSDGQALKEHIKGHEKKKERNYQCQKCGKIFQKQTMLTRHIYTHIPEDQCTFQCSKCDKRFPSNYHRKQHLNNVHLKKYVKICDICGKTVGGRELFKIHRLKHTNYLTAEVQCNICNTILSNKYSFARHKKKMHDEGNIKQQICHICGKMSSNVAAHQRHVTYMHNLKRIHKCSLCDKAFKTPRELKEHQATHTGQYLYKCPHCPKEFSSNSNMHHHRKNRHRSEWEESKQRATYLQNTFIEDDEKYTK